MRMGRNPLPIGNSAAYWIAMPNLITGSGYYAPDRVVTNAEMASWLGTTAESIEARTGVRERRFVGEGESAATMAEQAAREAIADAGLAPDDLDAIVFATLSPDVLFPGSGVFLQRMLGVEPIPALDVRNQCSGFLYGLSIAHAWLTTRVYDRVLLVGSEAHSPGLNLSEHGESVSLLFGDGAGAVVLERDTQADCGIIDIALGADGSGAEALWCEAPGSSRRPHITADDIALGLHFPKMKGRTVFRKGVETLERELTALFERNGADLADVLLVPHQANKRLNEMVAGRLGLADEQVVHTIERFGNTTAASLPMALDIARKEGRAPRGTLVAMCAFGSGYTWGTALMRL
jgi:3-oxoacyl-[acyl-carrier-protein] synthase III